jgi:hypothetical protein
VDRTTINTLLLHSQTPELEPASSNSSKSQASQHPQIL